MMNFKKVFVGLLFVVAIAFMLVFLDTLCVFKAVIGIPCPGCGMSRAWSSFFVGNFGKAFFFHPLFWLVPIVFVFSMINGGRVLRSKIANKVLWVIIAVLFLGLYVWRMLVLFPMSAPMDFNFNALLYKVIKILGGF